MKLRLSDYRSLTRHAVTQARVIRQSNNTQRTRIMRANTSAQTLLLLRAEEARVAKWAACV